jgi:hypothetical protein
VVLQAKTEIAIFAILAFLVCCGKKEGRFPVVALDPDSIPLLHTEDVSSLISDSGVTRYRLEARIWNSWQPEGKEPYWHFPERFHLEKFDSLFNVEATIDSDTAFYYERRELWRLAGNVRIRNLEGVLFETEELFWNQRAVAEAPDAIYTLQPVRVTMPNGDVSRHAGGFRADQQMHRPTFYDTSEELTFVEKDDVSEIDTISNNETQIDTIMQP